MARLGIGVLLLLGIVFMLHAQQDQYALYSFPNAAVNPAKINQNNSFEASSIFRSQRAIDGTEVTTAFLDLNYPFFKEQKRASSLGLSFGTDRVGQAGIFESNEVAVTYAKTLVLSRPNILSIGGSLKYVDARFNADRLSTGSQFVQGIGFDPGISPGESFDRFQTNYLSTALGIHWKVIDKTGTVKSTLGASFSDLNRPNGTFTDRTRLPIRAALEGIYRLKFSRKVSYYIDLIHIQSTSLRHTIAGFRADLNLYRYNRQLKGQHLELLTKYRSREAIIIGAIWQMSNVSFGTSYELPVENSASHNGAFEIVMRYKKRRKPKRKRKNSAPRVQRVPKQSDSDQIESLIEYPEEEQETEPEKEPGENVEHEIDIKEPILLHFKFEFGSAEPVLEEQGIIEEIGEILKNDLNKHISIVGHTDDIGSKSINMDLSFDRAESIFNLLAEMGVNPFQMTIDGRGEEEPISTNKTDEGRALNRRVEIIFLDD